MTTLTQFKMTALMLISSASLMACGDTEDDYLEPGYGHNFGHEAEMVQLAQVVNDDQAEQPWLAHPVPATRTLLIEALAAQDGSQNIDRAFDFNEPLDDETLESALSGNPLQVTPPLNAPARLDVQNMTSEELKRTCVAIDSLFDGVNATDMHIADCTANRLENVRSVQNDDNETCNLTMRKCIDNADTFVAPAAFCQTPSKVPTKCEIDYTEIASCLSTFKDSQVQLEAMDICDEGAVVSSEADARHDAHQAAQACLIKLDMHCPTFLQN